jgi:hypothetical protein
MHVGTTAKDEVVAATLGDMVIAAMGVDTTVNTIEDIVMDPELVIDMDIEAVVTLGTIQATEIQVTDMEAKRVGVIIVAATELVIIIMMVVVAIVTHAQDTKLETETITANTKDSSIDQGPKYVK